MGRGGAGEALFGKNRQEEQQGIRDLMDVCVQKF